MIIIYTISIIIVGLFILFTAWGLSRALRAQKNAAQAYAEVSKVSIDDIQRLNDECVQIFRDKFKVTLNYKDPDTMAQMLDKGIKSDKLVEAFAKSDFPWYFVLPVGAWLGEMLRHNSNAIWKTGEQYGPALEITLTKDITDPKAVASLTAYPLSKIVKHRTDGDPGDMLAYVQMALTGGEFGEVPNIKASN
jgi:hypothetical protein